MASSSERRRGRPAEIATVVALALAAGCMGAVDVGGGGPAGPVPAPPDGPAAIVPRPADPTGPRPPPGASPSSGDAPALPLAMARLTRREYRNAVRDVLGAAAARDVELEADYVTGGSATVGARDVTVSRSSVRLYAGAAEGIAARAVADLGFRKTLASCPGTADAACARALVGELGGKLFRRPLTKDELDRFEKVATTAAEEEEDFWGGMKWALAGLLTSPHFTHRVELGLLDDGKLVPTDHEIAARLSFTLWATTPDAALLAAADRGELRTAAGYVREVDRLLANGARLAEGLAALAGDLFALHELESVPKDRTRFPKDGPELRASMRAAVERLVDEVARGEGDFLSIFEPGFTFQDRVLAAAVGGKSTQAALEKVALPANGPRVGLLTEPALLALLSKEALTSPTLRGRFVREALLCAPVPDPPKEVENALPNTANGRTRREQLVDHMKNPACNACHRYMDPIGFGLELFDALGAVQETENGAPVIATGEVDGAPFDGPRELSRLVRGHPSTPGCLVRGVFRRVVGGFDPGAHGAAVDALTAQWKQEKHALLALVRRLVLSEAFRGAAPPR